MATPTLISEGIPEGVAFGWLLRPTVVAINGMQTSGNVSFEGSLAPQFCLHVYPDNWPRPYTALHRRCPSLLPPPSRLDLPELSTKISSPMPAWWSAFSIAWRVWRDCEWLCAPGVPSLVTIGIDIGTPGLHSFVKATIGPTSWEPCV